MVEKTRKDAYPDDVIDSLIQHDRIQTAMGLRAFSDYELKHYADEIMNGKILKSLAQQPPGMAPMPSGVSMPPVAGFQGNSTLPNEAGMYGTTGDFETDPMRRMNSRGRPPMLEPHPEWNDGVARI